MTAQGLAHRTDSTRSNTESLLARALIKGRVALVPNGHDPLYELTTAGRHVLENHFKAQSAMAAMFKPPRPPQRASAPTSPGPAMQAGARGISDRW